MKKERDRQMMFSRRMMLKGFAITAAGVTLAACTPKEPEPAPAEATAAPEKEEEPTPAPKEKVQITYHTRTGRDGDFYLAEYELFNAEYEDIEVILNQTPNAEYQSKIATLAAGGELGDAYWGNVFGQLYPFASAGIAMDVAPMFDADPDISTDEFFDVAIDQTRWNGMIIGLSMGIHPGWTTMYTNLTAWEEAGAPLPEWEWTYQNEWLDAIQMPVLDKDGDGSTDQFGYLFDYNAQNTYTFIRCWGSDWVDPNDRKTSMVLAEKTVEAIAFMRDLVHKYKCSPRSDELLDAMFVNGYTASWSTGNWVNGQFYTTIGDKFKWQGFPMPSGPGGRGSFLGCNTYCINNATEYPDQTWEAGKWLMSYDSSIRAVKSGMTTPSLIKAWEDPALRDDPSLQASKMWLDIATPWTVPGNARALEFRNTFNQGITAVLDGQNDMMEELKNLDAAIQTVLDKPAM